MDWNFGFYRRYFANISDIGRPRNDFEHIIEWEEYWENIGKIVEISAIYWSGIDISAIKSRVERRGEQPGITEKNRRFFGVFFEILKIFIFKFFMIRLPIFHHYFYIFLTLFIFIPLILFLKIIITSLFFYYIYLSFQFYLNFKCFYLKILKI